MTAVTKFFEMFIIMKLQKMINDDKILFTLCEFKIYFMILLGR